MVDLSIIPVRDIDGSVRPRFDIDRSKPLVGSSYRMTEIERPKGRLIRHNFAENDASLERFNSKQFPGISFGQLPTIINNKIMSEAIHIGMEHRAEIAKGVWIG